MSEKILTRRHFLQTAVLAAPALSLSAEETRTIDRPNIILIMADDLGYGDLGCYGCEDIQTPYIDGLAREGVRMTDYYASAPVCTPTRCALLTGRYQQRVPNMEWALPPGTQSAGLLNQETTIASMLREAGYSTGLFGKWHLGYREEWGPLRHGFDEFFGFLSGNIDYFRHKNRLGDPDLYENGQPVSTEGYITDIIAQHAVEFIQRRREKPFFLYAPFNAPHWPIQGPDDKDKELNEANWSQGGERSDYAKMAERMDAGIGAILGELKSQGLEENTLVVFCSDNGGGRLGRNAPLSGRKGHLREGGIRVPCLLRWPKYLPPGKVCSQAAIVMDLSSTIMAAARVKPSRWFDGFNMMRILIGERDEVEQTLVWRNTLHKEKALRWGKWKWLEENGEDYLFNLKEDIAERTNLKDRNFDILYWLKRIYEQWEQAMPYRQTLFGEDLKKAEALSNM
ncbi:MAG: sulfatase-like hydrolase/transferase [Candidatus Omnitrophota bacterium]